MREWLVVTQLFLKCLLCPTVMGLMICGDRDISQISPRLGSVDTQRHRGHRHPNCGEVGDKSGMQEAIHTPRRQSARGIATLRQCGRLVLKRQAVRS